MLTECRWPAIAIVVLGALLALPASAQPLDSAEDEGSPYYAPEEDMCYATDGGGAILSVGGTHTDDVKVACWAEYNPCKQKYAINVGDMWGGRQGGTRYLYPDSYYESGECGWATHVGQFPQFTEFYLYVGDAMTFVNSSSTDTSIKWKFDVWDYQNATDCSGYSSNHWGDDWQCCGLDVWAGDQNAYRDMSDYGVGDCGAADVDSGGCRMPDAVVTAYGGTSTAFRFRISMYVCDDSGSCNSNCSAMSYQEGCFYVTT